MSGPSGSGKTSFVRRFLLNLRHLCSELSFAGGVVWCYDEKSAVPSHLPGYIRFQEGVPEDFGSANSEPSLVILDDLLTVRSHIFPDEVHPIVVYSYVCDETSEDELSHSAGSEDGRP